MKNQAKPSTKTRQTAKRSPKERTGVDRLYKYVGVRKVSFYYQYPNGESETLASALLGDREKIAEAERTAKRKALDIQQGKIVAGSVAEMIQRFKEEIDHKHYRDQSKDGKDVRKGTYANLTKFFGKMHPMSLKMIHGYQYIEDRSKAGAPKKGPKELALMTTICHQAVEWGLIEMNPFVGMRKKKLETDVRNINRSQVVRFYLWSQRQDKKQFKTLGCAAMFTYLTGFRAAEVRPFHSSGLSNDGVQVIGAKRKKGEKEVVKVREWSKRLKVVVKRAQQAREKELGYLFSNRHGGAYTKSGWGSVWQDAMLAWIGCEPKDLVTHPEYFSLQDIRPAAITTKITKRSADMYDFAAHSNPATTHKHYDRRKIKRASATE
jgi:integrase